MSAEPVVSRSILGRKPSKVPTQDGRSPDAVLLRRTKAAFIAHVGGKPSATQRALVDRAAMLTLHLARLDAKAMQAGGFTDHDSRTYLAWSNSLRRTLAALGMKPAASPARTLTDHLATRQAAA